MLAERTLDEWRAAYLSRHRSKSDRHGVIKGPCPLCGGDDRFELRRGRRSGVAIYCRHCRREGFGEIAKVLFGTEDMADWAPPIRPPEPDPWQGQGRADELDFWKDHPLIVRANEIYPYRWPGGQLAILEVKGNRADGKKWVCTYRTSALGLVAGYTAGVYRWHADHQIWRKPKEARPIRGATYRLFDRVEPPLYRADVACHESGPVWLCAGPKDAEAGALVGLSTVAQAGGEARRIRPEWRRLLAGWDREVRILFDADEAGRKGAEKAARDLNEADCAAKVVSIEELAGQTAGLESVPDGFDLTDLVGELVNLQELAHREGLASPLPENFSLTDLLAWRLWRRPLRRRSGRG